MHTVKVIALGFVVLATCLFAGRSMGASLATSAKYFALIWLIGAAVNMWMGVSQAGYSVRDEFPIFLLIFSIPAAVAFFVGWRFSNR